MAQRSSRRSTPGAPVCPGRHGDRQVLGYLVPAVLHASATGKPVIVATATLALQGQIVDRDRPGWSGCPRAASRPSSALCLVKGRRNYVCRHKLSGGFPEDDTLFEVADSRPRPRLGGEVVRLRTGGGDRLGDPGRTRPRRLRAAWRQVKRLGRGVSRQPVPHGRRVLAEARVRGWRASMSSSPTTSFMATTPSRAGLLLEHEVLSPTRPTNSLTGSLDDHRRTDRRWCGRLRARLGGLRAPTGLRRRRQGVGAGTTAREPDRRHS